MMFAGAWDIWQGATGETIRSFAIITTGANASAQAIHNRMPVIVEPEDWPLWLGETEGDARVADEAPCEQLGE